jgi:hypothetical protein
VEGLGADALRLQKHRRAVDAKRCGFSKYFDRRIELRHEDRMIGQTVCKPLVNLPHAL